MLDELGIDYVEGGYPGANPTDTEFFAAATASSRTTFTAFGMTRRPGRSASNDPGLAALLDAQGRRHLLRRQVLGLSRARRARDDARGKPRLDPRQRARRARARAARCCSTASISSTATRPIPTTRSPAPRRPTRPARAGWCCATPMAARCRTRSRRSSPRSCKRSAGRPCRHPCPQRHRAGGRELARRGARRRAPDPGHAQRPRRALRQRQSRLDHPDPEAQAGIRRALRDRRRRRAARRRSTHVSHALDEMLNRAPNRHAPYVGESAFATKAGIHASAHRQGPGDLRARARPRRSATGASSWCRTRPAAPTCWPSSSASASRSSRDDPRVARLLDEVKEREAIGYAYEAADASFELLARRMLGKVPDYFDVDAVRRQCRAAHQRRGRARHGRPWRS